MNEFHSPSDSKLNVVVILVGGRKEQKHDEKRLHASLFLFVDSHVVKITVKIFLLSSSFLLFILFISSFFYIQVYSIKQF